MDFPDRGLTGIGQNATGPLIPSFRELSDFFATQHLDWLQIPVWALT